MYLPYDDETADNGKMYVSSTTTIDGTTENFVQQLAPSASGIVKSNLGLGKDIDLYYVDIAVIKSNYPSAKALLPYAINSKWFTPYVCKQEQAEMNWLKITGKNLKGAKDLFPADVELLFWGDSLTAGAGGNGTSYPGVCASELGITSYKNCGVGGETANTISARQGGNSITIPAGSINGTYQTLTDIFGSNIEPLLQGNGAGSGNKLFILGEERGLSYAEGTGYTISGFTGGSQIVPVQARFAGSDFTGNIVVIFVGQNGAEFTGLTGVDARMAIIDSMISHIGHNRYVVFGLSTGTDSSRSVEDEKLLAKYGNKFFPVRTMLVNYGLTINGLTPTSQDTTDIAEGTVPTSLRSDSVHMNAYGYTAIGKMLADKIRSLGYV